MKRFAEFIVQLKFVWGIFFTALIVIYSILGLFMGRTTVELTVILQLALVTILLTVIYFIMFGDYVITKLSTKARMLIHSILTYTTLLITAHAIEFTDITKTYELVSFTIGYIILYLLILFAFHNYYKMTGEELNSKLAAYKRKKNIE